MKCKNCGANVREGSAFCGRCGAPVPRPAPQPVKKYEYSGAVPKQKKNTGLIVAIILLAALIAAAAIIVCAAMYNRDDSGTNASETSTQAVVPTAEPVYVSRSTHNICFRRDQSDLLQEELLPLPCR